MEGQLLQLVADQQQVNKYLKIIAVQF